MSQQLNRADDFAIPQNRKPFARLDISNYHNPGAIVLSDESERASGRPLRFRLPGPRSNVVNSNNRLYPRRVLITAIDRARGDARNGRMIAYSPHPQPYSAPDGSTRFRTRLEDRVALVNDCFIDDAGQTWWDYSIIRTQKGRDLEASILASAPIGTSVRALGDTVDALHDGRRIQVARSLEIISNDFVENPALDSAMTHAQILADHAIELILASAARLPFTAQSNLINSLSTEEHNEMNESENNVYAESPAPVVQAGARLTEVEAQQSRSLHAIIDQATADRVARIESLLTDPRIESFLKDREASDRRKAVQAFLDDAVSGKEITTRDGVRSRLDLSRFSSEELRLIVDSCAGASMDDVYERLTSAIQLADTLKTRNRLSGMGYQVAQGGGQGRTVDHTVVVGAPQSYKEHVDKLCRAIDDYGMRTSSNFQINESLRRANQPFIDSVVEGWMKLPGHGRALTDSSDAFLDDAATLASLLQQPTITPATAALITQIYWQLSWLPMVGGVGPEGFNAGPGSDAGIGENLRIPVETRPSGRGSMFVGEGKPISTIHTVLRWLNFAPKWRKIGFELSKEAQVQLQRGSARYDSLARQLFAISQVISENIDLDLAEEHINASDEYQAVAVTGEAHIAGDVITNTTTLANMGYGSTVAFGVKTASTFTVNSTAYQRPIVPTRHTRVIQEDGSISSSTDTILNPISAQAVTSGTPVTLIQGLLSESGDIIDDPEGTAGAQFAVDYENGVFVFKSGVLNPGGSPATLPTIAYSYATNFDTFDLGPSSSATDLGLFYDGLLRKIDKVAATMGELPRYRPPSGAMFTLSSAVYAESARMAANLFSPRGSDIGVTAPNPNRFGTRSNIHYHKVNTPWRVGSGRILLFTPRATKYGVQYPFTVEGPIPNYAVMSDGMGGQKVVPIGNQFWIAQQNSVICTPVAFDKDGGGNIIQYNHPYRTIKLLGTATL